MDYFETSAFGNINVQQLFMQTGHKVLDKVSSGGLAVDQEGSYGVKQTGSGRIPDILAKQRQEDKNCEGCCAN